LINGSVRDGGSIKEQGLNIFKSIRSIKEVKRLGQRSEERSTKSKHFGSEEKKSLASPKTLKIF
jgi:hypothetical protein